MDSALCVTPRFQTVRTAMMVAAPIAIVVTKRLVAIIVSTNSGEQVRSLASACTQRNKDMKERKQIRYVKLTNE